MQPRTGNERGQALHKLKRRHHDMGGTVMVGRLELQHDLTGAILEIDRLKCIHLKRCVLEVGDENTGVRRLA